jgi:ParB family chromosome partitioning protein
MSEAVTEIQNISIDAITVLNPRSRSKKVFNELVKSISNLGLKKPITVSLRVDGSGFDLVCGQGRLEAFTVLGQKEIPAVVIQASKEDCYVMSLVENLARRNHNPLELVQQIGELKARGYSITQIANKTDFSTEYISALCYLFERGEEKLLAGVERGVIPYTIAIEISRAKDADVQRALAEAYERKAIPGNQIIAIRRIIDQRNASGKSIHGSESKGRSKRVITATALIRAYRRETDRQKLLVKKAALAQGRLVFVLNALRRLLNDEHFVTLLRAEALHTLPGPLAERIGAGRD